MCDKDSQGNGVVGKSNIVIQNHFWNTQSTSFHDRSSGTDLTFPDYRCFSLTFDSFMRHLCESIQSLFKSLPRSAKLLLSLGILGITVGVDFISTSAEKRRREHFSYGSEQTRRILSGVIICETELTCRWLWRQEEYIRSVTQRLIITAFTHTIGKWGPRRGFSTGNMLGMSFRDNGSVAWSINLHHHINPSLSTLK